jgi:A/G-specific adenine glycosylase
MLHSMQKWFDTNQRSLPWRKHPANPYEIWISEVMSQQSVLETVKSYFLNWMKAFPTLDDLAAATEPKVLERWAGLGYYSRARMLHKAAQVLKIRHDEGHGWPQNASQWLGTPGVGPYTAKAIASIAFSEPVLPMDGNLIRVLARFHGICDPLNQSSDLNRIKELILELEAQLQADALLEPHKVAQSFMDLGATVCRPKGAALCPACPIREHGCKAEQNQMVAEIPAPKKRAESIYLDYIAAPLVDEMGKVWVEPVAIGSPGNLVDQWQIPLQTIDQKSVYWAHKSQVRHAITRYRYRVRVVTEPLTEPLFFGEGAWVDPKQPDRHLTTLTRKILATFFT